MTTCYNGIVALINIKMKTTTVPAHIVLDEYGEVQTIIIHNEKTRAVEFFSVTRMGFQDIGEFLKTFCKLDQKV